MRRLLILGALVVFFSLSSSGVGIVHAQVPSELTATYKRELGTYREQYDKVAVALQQYANLKTLASQEEAVQSMRDFLLIRSDVLTAHFQILQFDLHNQKLVDPLWTASASAKIDTTLSDLSEHRKRNDIAIDRIRSDQEAWWFSQHEKDFKNAADRTQCLIGIGKTLQAISYLETVKEKVDAWILTAPISETTKVEKRRGSDELGRTIEEAKATLAQATTLYQRGSGGEVSNVLYPQIKPTLITAYTSLLRGVDFAKELIQ